MHREFVLKGQTVNAVFYLSVMKRLMGLICRVLSEYPEKGSWRLLHDNALAHRSTLITNLLTKNGILTINHFPYSPDLVLCNLYLCGKLHLAMEGKRYTDIEDFQKSTTAMLNIISTDEIKMYFNSLLDHAKRCIEFEDDYFE